jgi:hypothetical protein
MPFYGVNARIIVEANDEDDAASIVTDMLKDVENVDEVYTEILYDI